MIRFATSPRCRCLWFALMAVLVCPRLPEAQLSLVNNPTSPSVPLRFVFLVDTSSAAKRSAPTARNTVYDIIRSGMGGQIQPGQAFEIWPFNEIEGVADDAFPTRYWNPASRSELASEASAFLNEFPHRGDRNTQQALSRLALESKETELLTAFMLFEGSPSLSGTPYDSELNQIYRENWRSMRRQRRPFVTTLVLYRGQFVARSADPGGSAINVPGFDPPTPNPPAPTATPQPRPIDPPRVGSTRPAETPPPPQTASTPAVDTANAVNSTPSAREADLATATPVASATTSPASESTAEPDTRVAESLATTQPAYTPDLTSNTANSAEAPRSTPPPDPAPTTPATGPSTVTGPSGQTRPPPRQESSALDRLGADTPPPSNPAASPSRTPAAESASSTRKVDATPETETVPNKFASSQSTNGNIPQPKVTSAPAPTPTAISTPQSTTAPPPTPSVGTLQSGGSGRYLWMALGTILLTAAGAATLLWRRHTASGPSLISRSMDTD